MWASAGGVAIVGREAELAALDRLVRQLQSGQGGAVALTGEPGIGKTTLLGALTARVRAAGLPAVVGPRDRLADLTTGVDPGRSAAVVLDDLHHLPPGEIPALNDLVSRATAGPLLLAMAYRPRQLPPAVAAVLARGASGMPPDIWRVGPLDPAYTRALVGDHPNAELFHRAADGNPLYLRYLASGADGTAEPAVALLGELSGLTPAQARVAQTLAVVGGPVALDLLVAVTADEPQSTLDALDMLVANDLVRVTERAGFLAFRHPVLAQVVYDRVEVGQRRAVHARIEAELARPAVRLPDSDRPLRRPDLSRQETAVFLAYVSGLTLDAAARRARIRPGTAKQYLDRVKQKYEAVGRPTRTKLDLAWRAREDGLLA